MTIAEAKTRLPIDRLWTMLELPGEPGGSCRSPFREDHRPSFSISQDGRLYYDFAEGKGGDAVDFLQRATGLSQRAACPKFIELAESSPEHACKYRTQPTNYHRNRPDLRRVGALTNR